MFLALNQRGATVVFFNSKSHESRTTPRHPARRAAAIVATASLAAVGWVGLSATAAMAAPFDPNAPAFWVSQSHETGSTQIFEGVQAGGVVSFEQVGDQLSESTYNALGFRNADGYLWAVGNGPEGFGLKQIGDDGVVTHHDSDLVELSKEIDAGAFGQGEFADRLIVTSSALMENMYIVDVSTGAVETQVLTHGATIGEVAPQANDWTAYEGYLWGGQQDGGYIVRLDPATGILDMFPVEGFSAIGPLGAAWTYGNGNLAFSSNQTGEITQVQVDDPSSAAPTFSVVSVVPGPPTSRNDGASSLGAPTDLGVVKTAPSTVESAGTITWDIEVTNHSATPSSGFTLADVMPAGVTDVQAAGANAALCTVGGLAASCIGDPLAAGASVSYSFTGTAPSAEATLVNTVTVSANEEDPNPSNDSSSSTTTVAVAELARTGAEGTGLLAGSAAVLVLTGVTILVVRRRRQNSGA